MKNPFESVLGSKQPAESNPKRERYELRGEMADAVFVIGQITNQELGLKDIREGEVQSEAFIGKVRGILGDQDLWAKVPEQWESGPTILGASHKRSYTREGLRQELTELLEKHEQLAVA